MSPPIYQVGQEICIVESALLGFLEQYTIFAVSSSANGWAYSINRISPQPVEQLPLFGDRISATNQFNRFFFESELTDYCTALRLIKTNLETRLQQTTQLLAGCTGG